MNYAVWIALLVVFIAVVPPIIKNARTKNKDGGGDCGGGD